MAIIARLFTILLAYVLACISAAIVFTIGLVMPQWEVLAPNGLPSVAIWSVIFITAMIIVGAAALPALLVIALAEGFAWRSVVVYGALGGVLALALTYGIDFAGQIGGFDSNLADAREVPAAAGIAGGLVYWIFAGRKAGLRKS
jgi:hypothetical protein